MGYLLLLPCFSLFLYATSALNSDGLTLLSLLNHWTFVPHDINSTWKVSDSTPCLWAGVECNHTHNVVSLNLTNLGIFGQLGPEIGHLSHLQTLDLSVNKGLSGKIPPELSHCSLLEHLDLSENNFSGKIPESFTDLQNLKFMDLSSNLLTGEIPESLFQIATLEEVYLNNNTLSGSIPTSIGNMTQLLILNLYANQLSGTIPISIGNCSKLEHLDLSVNHLQGVLAESLNNLKNLAHLDVTYNGLGGTIPLGSENCRSLHYLSLSRNEFSGGIPSGLGNCSGLTEFDAAINNLVGTIPSTLGLLQNLSILILADNQLSGKIPPEIGNCKSLKELHLCNNQLEGEIPSELGMLSKLHDLRLYSNQLTGEIPLSIWKIQSLEHVLVYNNNLSGELPGEMTELKHLRNISLFKNQFSGIIPQSLGINSSLLQLDFMYNKFTGTLPPNLCFGKQLVKLNMGFNQFHGSIPADVGSCTTLTRVRLEECNFSGPLPDFERNPNLNYMNVTRNNISGAIPSSLGNCTNLTVLDVSINNFLGLLPSELGNLVNIRTLDLSHNSLEGPLPHELSNCTKMDKFDVGFNFLNGSFPSSFLSWTRLTTLVLQGNHFNGGIPDFLSEFKMLTDLQLGGNMFGGTIPRTIGELGNMLLGLNLSANGLIGELPVGIGSLKFLQRLDLSRNNLTGSIQVLDELHSLSEFNISYNSFVGTIPKDLVKLLNNSLSSFLGNPGLCVSYPLSDGFLKPCDSKSTSHKSLSKVAIVMIALGSSIFGVFLVLGLVYISFIRDWKVEANISDEKNCPAPFSKVMEATENLNDQYIIGRGAHGVVYKAVLGPDKIFAVKKVVFADSETKRLSMITEIQTLGKIRHRNLVRLEEFWFRKDHGLILYRYMPNGSLHDALHEKNPPQSLEWSVRYKMAVGIAHGLAYLHYDCHPAIVHQDIKTSNILLDSEMEPHIADFGIAKLLDQSSTSTQSISVAGTIGYIAPENAYTTVKHRESDVYSYGVVLLELITRKKALHPSFMEGTNMVSWVRSVWEKTRVIGEIVDLELAEEISDSNIMEQVAKVLWVALRCTEKDPHSRPTMRDVIKHLLDAEPQTTGRKRRRAR